MSFAEHLDELRRRLLVSLCALAAAIAGALAFLEPLFALAARPHARAMELLGRPADLTFTTFGDPVRSSMLLASIAGLLLASPVLLYQAWAFVGAGLTAHERRWVARFGPCSILLFLGGCATGYFVLVPYTLAGMAGLVPLEELRPAIVLGDYLKLMLALTAALGGLFQVPLAMAFLAAAGLADPASMARFRRHAAVAAALLGALLGPGDPASLLLLSLPPYLLYEAGLLAAKLTFLRRRIDIRATQD
jgi:sec-independent protein translocase protein TatC